jgi:hypothetical protein
VRTTFDIPAKLLNEATRISGGKSKNRVVVVALEDFVRRGRVNRLFGRAIGASTSSTTWISTGCGMSGDVVVVDKDHRFFENGERCA